MEGLSINASCNRITCLAREKEEKRAQERKRNLLYLVADFLREQGCTNACEMFVKEAHLSPDIEVCDNIDLETILLEYSEYYFAKFNKYPKICKKGEASFASTTYRKPEEDNISTNAVEKSKSNNLSKSEPNFNITVTPLFPLGNLPIDLSKNNTNEPADLDKFLKPLGNLYPSGSEWREIADIIAKEIVLGNLNVHWDDVKGLENCKDLLKEAAVYPLKYPCMFNEKLTPWKGVLLYGPPGTGKTMLAKAVATECKATFFNITSSSLISKWRGESEKYVRVLSDLAKFYAPSIIFIDEVDWTVSGGTNDVSNSKSEPSRRFRAELLARLDGLLSMENANVLLLAATNVPWELDTALLRRLEKRIYVDLPNEQARNQIFKTYLKPQLLEKPLYSKILKNTNGYSCADLKLLCKEAWMMQLRPVWAYLENENLSLKDYKNDEGINDLSHLVHAMTIIRPIAQSTQSKYEIWDKSFTREPIECENDRNSNASKVVSNESTHRYLCNYKLAAKSNFRPDNDSDHKRNLSSRRESDCERKDNLDYRMPKVSDVMLCSDTEDNGSLEEY
ncbi:katanin p60 ATPase-containing subunit A-like 2 isoform X2 [Nasonia vitripennis]|uniref:AAA+ ATPase domain-containing protein n=1 Tax=Nasonia vitripennis TaxID=7425 RepID=A0A7M7H6G4_NASVI|nr:katanin p60 ATPase-containing subunit A-like 2 isoform X2 [Nasonia vitripennis]